MNQNDLDKLSVDEISELILYDLHGRTAVHLGITLIALRQKCDDWLERIERIGIKEPQAKLFMSLAMKRQDEWE